MTNLPKLTQTYSDVAKDFGSIDGCITAAGIVLSKPFVEHEWDETMRVQMVNVCLYPTASHCALPST